MSNHVPARGMHHADESSATAAPEVSPQGSARPSRFLKPRLRRCEARDYLEEVHGVVLAVATLAKMACMGGGPPYNVSVRTPLYPVDELDRWAMQRLGKLVRSTSEINRPARAALEI